VSWRRDDDRVRGDLILSIATPLRSIIRNTRTAKGAWEKILAAYESKLASNVLYLKKEFYQCRLEDPTAKDAMRNHINHMAGLIDGLADVGTDISAEDAGVQLYLSLPDSYNHISAALSLKPVTELTFDTVSTILLQEERRLKGLASASLSATAKAESALAATLSSVGNSSAHDRASRPKCEYCHKRGHTEAVCYQKHGYPTSYPLLPSYDVNLLQSSYDANLLPSSYDVNLILLPSYDVNLILLPSYDANLFWRPMTFIFWYC
jgi:hypothetical protein